MTRYCVLKNTTTQIDGSDSNEDVMLQNALNMGFTSEQVEILTQAEYDARKALEPQPIPEPTDKERIEQLENMLIMMMEVM